MQPLGLSAVQQQAYLARLFGSHDYRVDAEVLTLDEVVVGELALLDGQVNLQDPSSTVRRTASLTVSDPAGALDFAGASSWSGSTVWVDRLIRIKHTIHVPALGRDVTVTPFIGPPSAMSRNGAEVWVECQDKTALAMRGASPLALRKGMNAVGAIRQILASRTGEFRFRLGTSARRLSKAYAVGWTDEAGPWAVAAKIARVELGMQLIYSCDGYATLRPIPAGVGLVVPHVTAPPQSAVDFTTLANWVRVAGRKTTTKTGGVEKTVQPIATAVVSRGTLTPANLARKGVPRYLPLVIDEEGYTKVEQTKARADDEIERASRLQASPALSCVPFFHGDVDDLVTFRVPGDDVTLRLRSGSIPLGVTGDMSIGAVRWVSRSPHHKVSGRKVRTRKRVPAKKTRKGKR